MGKLFINIKSLCGILDKSTKLLRGKEMSTFNCIEDAWLLEEDGLIVDFGEMKSVPKQDSHILVDLNNRMLLPTYCDSHTHIVFASPRDQEFVDRINGLTYEQIAKRGGGILNSVKKLREMSEDELFEQSKERLRNVILMGTGAIEIKSGYGLSLDSEVKMLRIIKRLKGLEWIPIKSTLLAAHALPTEYKADKLGYLKMIVDEIMPVVQKEDLADYVDIFCEKGYFDLDDTNFILENGLKHGLKGKIHVNQFNILGGVKAGVDHGAISVDHLEYLDEDDIEALKNSDTIATALPSCSFFLKIPYTPARTIIDSGLPLALATDYNPGSTPSGNMGFVNSLGCIKQDLTPEEAFNASMINGAAAMELSEKLGSITKGKLANFMIMKEIPSLAYIPYSFADQSIDQVYIKGQLFE